MSQINIIQHAVECKCHFLFSVDTEQTVELGCRLDIQADVKRSSSSWVFITNKCVYVVPGNLLRCKASTKKVQTFTA